MLKILHEKDPPKKSSKSGNEKQENFIKREKF